MINVTSPRLPAYAGTLFFLIAANLLVGQTASVTISDEAYGNNSSGRTEAAKLDDSWAAGFASGVFSPNLFSGGSGMSGVKSFSDDAGNNYQVGWQVGYIDDTGPGTPTSTTFKTNVTGTVTYGQSSNIQAGAPNPFPSETRITTNVNSNGLNAVRLDFTKSTYPITEFGIFVGDLESRPIHGTVARILVFNTAGQLMSNGDNSVIYRGTVKNGTNYTVAESSPTGPENNDEGDWGEKTTSFITVSASDKIGYVVFQVGDDDYNTINDGGTENLGLVGFQLPQHILLPITLKSFDVASRSDLVEVKWTTAYEENIDHFVVLRSRDGHIFQEIARVKANSQGHSNAEYSFQDFQPDVGNSYYKLQEVTIDNQRVDHGIRSVVFEGTTTYQMATFWSGNQVKIDWLQEMEFDRRITIYSVDGQPLFSGAFRGSESTYLPIGEWPSGFYFVSILYSNGRNNTVKCYKP